MTETTKSVSNFFPGMGEYGGSAGTSQDLGKHLFLTF